MVYLNYTIPQAPTLDKATDLLTIQLNGLFYDEPRTTTHITSGLPTSFPDRLKNAESEQLWIHQTTFNSLILGLTNGELPIDLTNPNITNIFAMFMPEITSFYGKNSSLEVDVVFKFDNEGFIKIDQE